MSTQSRSPPQKRARRAGGFAVRAEYEAKQWVKAHQTLPSLAVLRSIVGGGSQRDLAHARSAAQAALLPSSLGNSDEAIYKLRAELEHYKHLAANAIADADERVRGLERHLLLETARIRDELEQRARIKSPFGTVVQTITREEDPREERIYE